MRRSILAVTLLAGGLAVGSVTAGQGPTFTVIEENDTYSAPFSGNNQDRHYTQGLKLVWMGGDAMFTDLTASLERAIPAWGLAVEAAQVGWVVIAQNIYTPEDILQTALIKDDRPYAGWLYSGLVLVRRGATDDPAWRVLESLEAQLGVIGPESLAEWSQNTVHRLYVEDRIPKGWDNQLNTEPGLLFKYGRAWRLRDPDAGAAAWIDLIPHAGAALGNVQVWAAAGATLRIGWNLPDDFGPQTIDSPIALQGGGSAAARAWGLYAFGRVEGRAIAWNTFLDGNLFSSSHHVTREPFVADLTWGLVFQITRYLEFGYTRIIRTEEFTKQDGRDVFGSLLFKFRYDF